MKKILLISLLAFWGIAMAGQEYDWKSVSMDGSRTGTSSPSKDNVPEAIGEFQGRKYVAPSGKTYSKKSIVGQTAAIVMAAQPKMARVKDVIAYSPKAMAVTYPESALSDWFVDIIMAKTEKLAGKKVHVGVANFGGIRVDMPEGDVILDDMLSMFPFKNQLVYVEHTGKQIRTILETMAADRFEVLGGVRVVAEGGRIVSAEIAGEPIDDDKVYGMATISFLLEGGDGLALGQDALTVEVFEDEDIIDAVLEFVHAETAAGRPIVYEADGRVVVKDLKKKRK